MGSLLERVGKEEKKSSKELGGAVLRGLRVLPFMARLGVLELVMKVQGPLQFSSVTGLGRPKWLGCRSFYSVVPGSLRPYNG